jgi:2',3'-cyclic-nucleotide 2'-phosphodiesterase (5'-nucleotidase family)
MVAQERAKGDSLLLLDGGDSLMSEPVQPLSLESQGRLVIEAMNLLGYDAIALGERDLLLGPDALRQRIDEADFPVLSANVRLAETGELLASPYTILNVGGLSIGIIGLTGTSPDSPPAFTISDPIAAAEDILKEVEPQADLIVVLSHLGWDRNKELADQVSAIDVVISGGMQKLDDQPYHSPTTGARLSQAELPTAGHAGRFVGLWKLTIDRDGQIKDSDWRAVFLDSQFVDDPAMVALLAGYRGR